MSANVGPYITNLGLEQRRRELKAQRFEGLAEAGQQLAQTMFAWQELNQQKARDRATALTEALKMYGGAQSAPQDLVNKWAGATEVAVGSKKPIFPRDSSGNVVPPTADMLMDPNEKAYLATLPPEERAKHFMRKFGDLPAPGQEGLFSLKVASEREKERHDRAMEAATWARASNTGRGQNWRSEESKFTIDENGRVREAAPGENRLTRGDILDWMNVNKLSTEGLRQRKLMLDLKVQKDKLQGDKQFLSYFSATINTLSKITDKKRKDSAIEGVWNNIWRPHWLAQGNDPGEFPGSVKASSWWSTVTGAADVVLSPLKPVKPSGTAEQPQLSPEEELNQWETR